MQQYKKLCLQLNSWENTAFPCLDTQLTEPIRWELLHEFVDRIILLYFLQSISENVQQRMTWEKVGEVVFSLAFDRIFSADSTWTTHHDNLKKVPKTLFTILDPISWNIDEGSQNSNEITPIIYDYRHEFRINQRELGAYYTPVDITQYMTQSAILITVLKKFIGNPKLNSIDPKWLETRITYLHDHLEDYIYPSVKHGMNMEIPGDIFDGFIDITLRKSWSQVAPLTHANAGETWRNFLYRMQWYRQIEECAFRNTESFVQDILTYNLDLKSIWRDLITSFTQGDHIAILKEILTTLTILDPTCGTGSFLSAAIDVLMGLLQILESQATRITPQIDTHKTKNQSPDGDFLRHIWENTIFGIDLSSNALKYCKIRMYLQACKFTPEFSINEKSVPSQALDKLTQNLVCANFLLSNQFSDVEFNIILGNPPYLELNEVSYNPHEVTQFQSNTIHTMCIEKSLKLLHADGFMTFIIPMAITATQRMQGLQKILEKNRSVWYANFAWRPGKLFENVNRALTIILLTHEPSQTDHIYSTNYIRWYAGLTLDSRPWLFEQLRFYEIAHPRPSYWVPKIGHPTDSRLLEVIFSRKDQQSLGTYLKTLSLPKTKMNRTALSTLQNVIFYRSTGGLYWKVFTPSLPQFFHSDTSKISTRTRIIGLNLPAIDFAVIAVLNSDYFWWWYTLTSNLRDLNPSDIENLPIVPTMVTDPRLATLGKKLIQDLDNHSELRNRHQKETDTGINRTQHFLVKKSKALLDEIDTVIADIMSLSSEELDYLQHFDITFRMNLIKAAVSDSSESD